MKALRLLALAGALSIVAPQAAAATCSVSAVSLAFGSYNPFKAGHTDTTGNIAVTCSGKPGEVVAYSIALSAGGGTFAARRMKTASGFLLNYNIYTGPTRTVVWGDGSGGSVTLSDSYTLAAPAVTRNYAVYGRSFGSQKALIGIYSDSIVVTLNF